MKSYVYLLLTFLLHAQCEHGMEVWTGDSQQGSVSRDSLVLSHQDHIAEPPVLPLFIEALQDLHRLIHTVENLHRMGKKKKKKEKVLFFLLNIATLQGLIEEEKHMEKHFTHTHRRNTNSTVWMFGLGLCGWVMVENLDPRLTLEDSLIRWGRQTRFGFSITSLQSGAICGTHNDQSSKSITTFKMHS